MKHALLCLAAMSLPLSACSGASVPAATLSAPDHQVVQTAASFADTESRLRAAIGSRDLRLFTVVDHGAGARSVGQDIGESKLFIFGNPKGGTPLMAAAPGLGLDLPLKVLIQTVPGGGTEILHTDIKAIAARHGVTGQDARLDKIAATLADVVREAAG